MPSRIGDALRWYATYTPQQPAIVSPSGRVSYKDLWLRAVRLAHGLVKLGIRPGDRIALLLVNGAPYLELYHAAALMGAAVVPLNFRLVRGEIEDIVSHSRARGLVFDGAFASLVDSIRDGLTEDLRFVVEAGPTGTAPNVAWATPYESLIASSDAVDWMGIADLEECYFQGYTSGTTGFPKGCVNPHRPFADCLRRMGTLYGVTPHDIEIVAAPLFHEAPALFALTQMFRGGTVVVTHDSTPESVLSLIASERVTWAFMVPTMWAAIVASDDLSRHDLSSLRIVVSGGSPLQTHTKLALLAKIPAAGLHEFYGGTEVGLVSNLEPADQLRKVRSVGKPIIGMYVELRDDAGNVVPQGAIGEVHIGGATLIREYFNNPEATARARSARGFFTLGDMGRFDEEGYLYIVDRKIDMIISGGENIFPNDIEAVLYQHPSVHVTAVVGAPDARWGEIVVAVVVTKPGETVDEMSLIEHCKARLSSFKVPKRIDFSDALPMSAFGKILRREVRQHYWKDHEDQV